MSRIIYLSLILFIEISWACHSFSPQSTQYSARRARARGATLLENENAIDFDYLTSNLPISANDIRSMSSMMPFPNKPSLTVSEGGKLTCFFDDEMEYCGWHNAPETGLKFWRGKLEKELNPQLLESFSTEKYFLLAGGEPTSNSETAAIEVEIPCQYGDAEVKFDFWTNKPNVNGEIIPRTINPLNFSVPTTAEELKLRIEMFNFDADTIVLIDNLHYNGQVCELVDEVTEHESTLSSIETLVPFGSTDSSTVSVMGPSDHKVKEFFAEENEESTTIGSDEQFKELSPCSALTCSFNDGDSCFYGLTGPGSTASWSLSDKLVGNRHTGIQRLNLADQNKVGFIYVGDDFKSEENNVFVVESPKFSLETDSFYLVFDVYLRSISPILKVCINDFENCPYKSPPLQSKLFWHENQRISLKSGSKKIFFVAEKVKKHHFLAVDNVRIESENGSSVC